MEVIDLEEEAGYADRSGDRCDVIDIGSSDNDSVVEVETSSPTTKHSRKLIGIITRPSLMIDKSPFFDKNILDLNNWLSSDTNVEDSFAHLLAKPSPAPHVMDTHNILENDPQRAQDKSLNVATAKALLIEEECSIISGNRDYSINAPDIDTTFDEHPKICKHSSANFFPGVNDDDDDDGEISIVLPDASPHLRGSKHRNRDNSLSGTATPSKKMPQIETLPMPLFMSSSQDATHANLAVNSHRSPSPANILRSSPHISNHAPPHPPSENAFRDTWKRGDALVSKPGVPTGKVRVLSDLSGEELSDDDLAHTAKAAPRIVQLSDPIESSQSSPLKPTRKRSHNSQAATVGAPPKRSKSNLSTQNPALPILDIEYSAKELKDANRVTRKRPDLMAEMILLVPQQIFDTFDKPHLKEAFEGTVVEPYGSYLPLLSWHRNLKARYDRQLDVFIPSQPHIKIETHKVLYYDAREFCDKLMTNRLKYDCTLAIAISKKECDADFQLTIMVEGYDQFLSKLRNNENNQYKSQVLDRLSSSRGTDSSPTKSLKKSQDRLPNFLAKDVERCLNQTQLECGINIFPVRTRHEAIDWLASQTYTIAWSLYDKFERNNSLANLGLVRSGSDPKSTFLQSIRQFKFMTEAKADKLYCIHQSLPSIFAAFNAKGTLGTDTNGKNIVPPSVETAMKIAFLSTDPGAFIEE